jgi:hypothetical protein
MQTQTTKTKIMNELIRRNIVQQGTPCHAVVTANGIGGQPVRVLKSLLLGDLQQTSAKGWTRDNAGKDHVYNVKYDDINAVEGMELTRLAQAYKIKFK